MYGFFCACGVVGVRHFTHTLPPPPFPPPLFYFFSPSTASKRVLSRSVGHHPPSEARAPRPSSDIFLRTCMWEEKKTSKNNSSHFGELNYVGICRCRRPHSRRSKSRRGRGKLRKTCGIKTLVEPLVLLNFIILNPRHLRRSTLHTVRTTSSATRWRTLTPMTSTGTWSSARGTRQWVRIWIDYNCP